MTTVIDSTVPSKSLRRIVYSEAEASLWVEFTSGAVYRYADVPLVVVQQLFASDSHGQFFSRNVRNSFAFETVNEDLDAIARRIQAISSGQRFVLELPLSAHARPVWDWAVAEAA